MRENNLQRFSDYEKVSWSHHYYLSLSPLAQALQKVIKKYAQGKIMDIGCGNKPYEQMFIGIAAEYIGCDIVQSSMNKVDFICEATKIPLPDSSFNTVISTQAIEHIEDHQAMVKESFRLLKPGGHIIISGPMYWHLHEEPYDYFRFTKYGFRYILENNNFEVLEILSTGGKWALFGQVIIHTFPIGIVRFKLFRTLVNRLFSYLDKNHFNDFNTTNYVIVGQKRDES